MEVDGVNLAVGGGAVTALAGLAGAWIRARYGRAKVEPTPLPVDKVDKYVTRDEFARHVGENERAHENLFARLNRNDRETSEIKGMLSSIMDDLKAIKGLMMGDRK